MSLRPGFARGDTDFSSNSQSDERRSSNVEKPKGALDAVDEKNRDFIVNEEAGLPAYDADDEFGRVRVVSDAKDIVTEILRVEDDPTLSPWTFRMFFLGLGLTAFGSVLQEIYYFKPQVIFVSVIFLTVIAYVLGEAMAYAIPRWGPIGRFLNPGPFNSKEHAAIVIMASAASQCALATEALAVQRLYYGIKTNAVASVFVIMSSQLLGLAVAGLMRRTLVYPTKMLWPINLPLNTLLETLHRDKRETKTRLKVFYIVFACLFIWEVIPEYIMPVLTGVSIFCLANQKSLVFTNLFGGSQGNEGLGFSSICLDWQYIASTGSPLWVPLQTLFNSCVGYLLCIVLFLALYYGNVWNAQNFPFLAQQLFDANSTSTNWVTYDQNAILNNNSEIDPTKLAQVGIPWMAATYIAYLITSNMGLTATFTHMFLWNYDDIKTGWSFASPSNVKKLFKASTWKFWQHKSDDEQREADLANPDLDPHYKLLLNYPGVPQWWWLALLASTFVIGLVCIYVLESTLPWWGYVISIMLSALMTLFFGAQMAITGFQFNQQPIVQMLAGYLHPNRPVANMYFTVFGYNSVWQGELLLKDLKLAQFAHLSPRCTFTVQLLGSTVGAIFNYIMMVSIVDNQAEILLSTEGSNIWSGQNLQQYNTLAIAWSIASDMFSVGGRYEWVTLSFLVGFAVPLPFWLANKYWPSRAWSYWNLSIILWYMGWLFVGINSSILLYFVFGFVAQWYLRVRHPRLFNSYNYLVSAALDGGTQVIVFILSFAVFGGSGSAVNFPLWAGNNGGYSQNKNIDFCAYNLANNS